MAAVNIPINVQMGNTSGLNVLTSQVNAMKRSLGATGGQSQAGLNIALNITPGNLSGIQALQQAMGRPFQTLPGGGIQRVGYTGPPGTGFTMPPAMAGGGPGGLPPRPPGASPFGTFAPPLPGPPRPGSPTWLAAHGYTGVPPGPPAPPVSPQDEDEEPGLARRALGRIRKAARLAGGVVAGVGIYQTLTQSMALYEQRARGIIDVGMRLDLQFDQAGRSIDRLRDRYQVLAHDSIAAMQTFSHVTGTLTGLEPAVRTGVAYGMAPTHAADLARRLTRLTQPGPNPLATIAATSRMLFTPGLTPMSTEALLEETTAMAETGGTAAARMPAAFYGGMAGLIGSLGERYQVPGAISGFYGHLRQGLNQAPDPTTQALRYRALGQLRGQRQARGLGSTLRIGEETFDLSTYWGQTQALELAADSPEIMEAFRQQAHQISGGRPELEGMAFQRLFAGEQLGAVESERLRRGIARRPGGLPGLHTPGAAATAGEEALIAERYGARAGQPEFAPQLAAAMSEHGLEKLGEPLVKASSELRTALASLTDVMKDGQFNWKALEGALTSMSSQTVALIGALTLLGANTTAGQILGGSLLGGAAITGLGGGIGSGIGQAWQRFHLAPPGSLDPGADIGGGPALTPTRPAP